VGGVGETVEFRDGLFGPGLGPDAFVIMCVLDARLPARMYGADVRKFARSDDRHSVGFHGVSPGEGGLLAVALLSHRRSHVCTRRSYVSRQMSGSWMSSLPPPGVYL
jgi:hypothetical protein